MENRHLNFEYLFKKSKYWKVKQLKRFGAYLIKRVRTDYWADVTSRD